MGLDIYLADGNTGAEKTYGEGEDAETYTEYETREYYLRSSYNESGFNSVTEKLFGLYGYYYVFEPVRGEGIDEYETVMTDRASLDAALVRAHELYLRYKESNDVFTCSTITGYLDKEQAPQNAAQAMTVFRAERTRFEDRLKESKEKPFLGFTDYSNREGTYFMDGFEVYAAIVGVEFGRPCCYLVYKMKPEALVHYTEAAQKAVDLIEEAIKMLDAGGRPVLQWSA